MKVLIVSFYYPPEIGAAPSRIFNMAKGLKQKGADVEVLTCLPNYPKGHIFEGYRGCLSRKEVADGILLHRYWTYATVSKNPIARLLGMFVFALDIWIYGLHIRKIRSYDRIIIQSPPLLVGFSATLLFRCLYGKKNILNVSDLWPLSAIELGAVKQGSLYHRGLSWMENFVYKKNSAIQGQSNEILKHIEAFGYHKPYFLYRNLQPVIHWDTKPIPKSVPFRIVYAGLLGIAQDILGIIENINFKDINAELHIFGGGNQFDAIQSYIKSHQCGVVCHGYKTKEEVNQELGTFHASIVPLAVSIKGAVPSKIFDLLPHGIPMLFCGGGEGEVIIKEYQLGYVSQPRDYNKLKENIMAMEELSESDYQLLRSNCIKASKEVFSFDSQMGQYYQFLQSL